MRSTSRAIVMTALAAMTALALAGCSATGKRDDPPRLPRIMVEGTRHEYTSLAELADVASAVVVAVPTGVQFTKPLPAGYGPPDAAPTPYVQIRVTRVLSGTIRPGLIDLVSPGIDENTGEQALARGGPYLIYITPAMYRSNDPAGGYVAVGGPAGVYGATGRGDQFARVDRESTALPPTVQLGRTDLPKAHKTEKQLLQEGPK